MSTHLATESVMKRFLKLCDQAAAAHQRNIETLVYVICQKLERNPFEVSVVNVVKFAYGYGKNVKSHVENYVNLTCSAVIFQQGPNLLQSTKPLSVSSRKCHLPFSLKGSLTTSSSNGKIVFSVCHFLFPPISSPRPTLQI